MDFIPLIICYLIVINAAAFLLMLIDKKKAQKKQYRISEATLLTVAGLGGSIGALAGMYTFRHKTRKKKFTVSVPAMLIIHVCFAVYLYLRTSG